MREEKTTVMVRGISKQTWQKVRESAEDRGLKLKYAMEEMMGDWLNKQAPERGKK